MHVLHPYPIPPPPVACCLQTSSQGATTNVTNEEALQRSVDMASRMAGWAGRVVERVLKEHRQVTLRFTVRMSCGWFGERPRRCG